MLTEITSKENSSIKRAVKLLNKKHRDNLGLFLVEGLRAVQDIISSRKDLVEEVFVTQEKRGFPFATAVVCDKVFKLLCETENAQGVVAVIKKPVMAAKNCRSLFLDRVRDPGNLGTLIRTAAAVGFEDVYLFDSADAYSGKVVRSTMAAMIKVNLLNADTNTLFSLKNNGYTVVCADISGKNAYSYKQDSEKICLVIGNEANGISSGIKEICDVCLSLPMINGVESLNAAVSGSILMYNLKYLI